MNAEQLRKILADNLKALKIEHGLESDESVQKKTKVSKPTVNNIVNAKHATNLDTLCLLAMGFKVPPWSLLHENGPGLYKDKRLLALLDAYAKASPDARDLILRLAQSQVDE